VVLLQAVVFWGIVLWLLTTFGGVAHAQSRRTQSFYDKNGSFAGQSFTYGKSTSFSDKNGSFAGSSIRHGNSTSHYDRNGSFVGSTIDTGPRR
jgi:hypothetical protein